MNLNEAVFVPGKGRGRCTVGKTNNVVSVQRAVMGPPKRPVPKRKKHNTSTSSSLSRINWGKNGSSSFNNSSLLRTHSSSRSYSSTEPESRIVIALCQGRGEAVCEVGIAAINITRPSLILCQIADSHSYINTLTKINILNPSEILIPLTFVANYATNRLTEKVKEQFQNIKISAVARSSFNKIQGMQYMKDLCLPSLNSVLLILQYRYYALAAASALFMYTERSLYIAYAKESINIEYQESEGFTIIDVATADRLELVASTSSVANKKYSSLFGIMNHCLTKIGTRTLRASILQPPCSIPDIEARLDCVSELIRNPDLLVEVQNILGNIANIDQLLSLATVMPSEAEQCSERQLNYILILNSLLDLIQPLQKLFRNSTQAVFIELHKTLGNPEFADIKELVETIIHKDARPAKGQYGVMQRCFAIKSGINGLLDVIRKIYSERMEDMRNYVKSLGEQYGLALSLNNNNKKGYHIVLTLTPQQRRYFHKTMLPAEFIQVEHLATCFTMSTQNLIDLSARCEDIMIEIIKMSNIMIYKLLEIVRNHIGLFYKLCEDIAKLDMLQSLAVASSVVNYVRPKFGDYLEITEARHPLLEFLCRKEPIANPMSASNEYNIHVITGPNGSGKSIFIRQLVLIQVMAQVGCFVPAEMATFRVADRILTRVYLEDNMEYGASAFILEMKEILYILTTITKNSIVIIDELCRSTSVEEGTAIAMAICEKLLNCSAYVFITTHFHFLSKLEDMYYNVKKWQLETVTNENSADQQLRLLFTHKLISGVTAIERYGIYMAKASWPEGVVKYAETIITQLSTKQTTSEVEKIDLKNRLKYNLEAKLQCLKRQRKLTRGSINQELTCYHTDLQKLNFHTYIENVSSNNSQSINENNKFEDTVQSFTENSEFINNQASATENNFCVILNNTSHHKEGSEDDEMPSQITINSEGEFQAVGQSNATQAEKDVRETFALNENAYQFSPQIYAAESENSSVYHSAFMQSMEIPCGENSIFTKHVNENPGAPLLNQNLLMENFINSMENLYKETNQNQVGIENIYEQKTHTTNFLQRAVQNSINYTRSQQVNLSCAKNLQSSFLSENEMQFSLPLQLNIEKTSTPIIQSRYTPVVAANTISEKAPSSDEKQSTFKTSSDGILWKTTNNDVRNIAEENHRVDPDVSAALEDLQDCSESFFESEEEWVEANSGTFHSSGRKSDKSSSISYSPCVTLDQSIRSQVVDRNCVLGAPNEIVTKITQNCKDYDHADVIKKWESRNVNSPPPVLNSGLLQDNNGKHDVIISEAHHNNSQIPKTKLDNNCQMKEKMFDQNQVSNQNNLDTICPVDGTNDTTKSHNKQLPVEQLNDIVDTNLVSESSKDDISSNIEYKSSSDRSKRLKITFTDFSSSNSKEKNIHASNSDLSLYNYENSIIISDSRHNILDSQNSETRANSKTIEKCSNQNQIPENSAITQSINIDSAEKIKLTTPNSLSSKITPQVSVQQIDVMEGNTITKSANSESASKSNVSSNFEYKSSSDRPKHLKISFTGSSGSNSIENDVLMLNPDLPQHCATAIADNESEHNNEYRGNKTREKDSDQNKIKQNSINNIDESYHAKNEIHVGTVSNNLTAQMSVHQTDIVEITKNINLNTASRKSEVSSNFKHKSKCPKTTCSKNSAKTVKKMQKQLGVKISRQSFSCPTSNTNSTEAHLQKLSIKGTKTAKKHLGVKILCKKAHSDYSSIKNHTSSNSDYPSPEQLNPDSTQFCKRVFANTTDHNSTPSPKIFYTPNEDNVSETINKSKSAFENALEDNSDTSKIQTENELEEKNKCCVAKVTDKNQKIPKFKPLKTYTKRQIEEDYYEQTRKMLENYNETKDSSTYVAHILNRPTVHQLQQMKTHAVFHKTSTGIVCVPSLDKKPIKKRKITIPLKRKLSECEFNSDLLCDKKSHKFDEFLQQKAKKPCDFAEDDNKNNVASSSSFQITRSEVFNKNNLSRESVCVSQVSNSINLSQKSTVILSGYTPDGYYKQNKASINNIIQKYLEPESYENQNYNKVEHIEDSSTQSTFKAKY